MEIANPVPPEFCVSFCALGACLIVFVCLFQPDVAQSSNSYFFSYGAKAVLMLLVPRLFVACSLRTAAGLPAFCEITGGGSCGCCHLSFDCRTLSLITALVGRRYCCGRHCDYNQTPHPRINSNAQSRSLYEKDQNKSLLHLPENPT